MNARKEKKCTAGKCSALFTFMIVEDKCKRCGLCVRMCPSEAIQGNREDGFRVNEKCIKCGVCHDVCKFGAIEIQ